MKSPKERSAERKQSGSFSPRLCCISWSCTVCQETSAVQFWGKSIDLVETGIVIPRRPSKAHHISSCTWNSDACWSEGWFLTNGKQRVPLTTPDALMNAAVSRCAILHGSNYTHSDSQTTPAWRWSENEQIPAWTNVHIHSHVRVHIVTLNGLCM